MSLPLVVGENCPLHIKEKRTKKDLNRIIYFSCKFLTIGETFNI